MKRALSLLIFTVAAVKGMAQKIDLVTLTGYGANVSFYYTTADKISIVLTKDGNIAEYGTDYGSATFGYWPGRLNKYMGRVEYYSATDDAAFRGKVKYIGLTMITYYGSAEESASVGKVKSIGGMPVDYYPSFEDASVKGNIKKVGTTQFSWFGSFENDAVKGRIKSIGNTQFTWYTSFDDKSLTGKVKSIDMYNFTYYTSFENNNGQKGMLKTGFQTKYINGINYYVRN